jgi:hypothetical protein
MTQIHFSTGLLAFSTEGQRTAFVHRMQVNFLFNVPPLRTITAL